MEFTTFERKALAFRVPKDHVKMRGCATSIDAKAGGSGTIQRVYRNSSSARGSRAIPALWNFTPTADLGSICTGDCKLLSCERCSGLSHITTLAKSH